MHPDHFPTKSDPSLTPGYANTFGPYRGQENLNAEKIVQIASSIQIPQSAIINPLEILDRKIVRSFGSYPAINRDFNDPECAVQQNGIDLRLAEVAKATGHTSFGVNKKNTIKCSYQSVLPTDDWFSFDPLCQYAVDFMEEVEIPKDMSAYIIVRSSVNRYSGSLMVGWWDSGYCGRAGGIFRPMVKTDIQKGFRMGQIVFFRSDAARLYSGQYQNQTRQVEVIK